MNIMNLTKGKDREAYASNVYLVLGDSNAMDDVNTLVDALMRLARKDVKAIYFGHGDPMLNNCNARIRDSLKLVKESLKMNSQTGVMK